MSKWNPTQPDFNSNSLHFWPAKILSKLWSMHDMKSEDLIEWWVVGTWSLEVKDGIQKWDHGILHFTSMFRHWQFLACGRKGSIFVWQDFPRGLIQSDLGLHIYSRGEQYPFHIYFQSGLQVGYSRNSRRGYIPLLEVGYKWDTSGMYPQRKWVSDSRP